MHDPRHRSLLRLFAAALERPADVRRAYLDAECGEDAALKQQLHALLAALELDPLRARQASTVVESLEPGPGSTLHEGPGTRIGRYTLLEKLGEGGFGVVFLAEQTQPVARQVALKIIKLGMDTRQVVARFEQERQALALMNHPNIARVIDAGATETGRPYFVMELVQGPPIGEYCDRNALTLDERLELFEQVCGAVQHAHQKGIIHRDLKPGNLLVATQDGKPHVKVIDFGIAKATQKLTDKTLFTEQEQVIGTLLYMSPEQAEGSLDIDTRTDVYALGVVLYELLTGSTPVDTRTVRDEMYSEIVRRIREVDPPRPSTRIGESKDMLASLAARRRVEPQRLGSLVRGELDWIVMKALEKDRSRRYESASSLALDIRRHLSGEAVQAAPASAAYRLRKFVRRNRGTVTGVAAVGAALLVGAIAFAWQARRAREQRDRAILAEGQSSRRAGELQRVADYQAAILGQIDATDAGLALMADLRGSHAAALAGIQLATDERAARTAAFERELHVVNATDAAVALIDRTILEPAAVAVAAEFQDLPVVDASLRTTLGTVYSTLGRSRPALALFERAYELRLRWLGAEHPDTLAARAAMGQALGELQELDEAERTLRDTLDVCRRVLGADHALTLDTQGQLAAELDRQGHYEDCVELTRDVLERRRRLLGEDHADTLSTLSRLGLYLMKAGAYEDAESVLLDVVERQRGVLDASLSDAMTNLGAVLQRLGKLDEAELWFREALVRTRRDLGEDHPDTLAGMHNLAALLMAKEELGEAESLARESLDRHRRVWGDEHADTLKAMNVLGEVLFAEGKLEDAETYYRAALETGRRVLGEEHPDTIIWIANLAAVLKAMDRNAEAEPYYREAVEKNRRALGGAHPHTLAMLKALVDLLRRQGRPAEAEPYLRNALDDVRAAAPPDDPELLALLGILGGVLRDAGKLDDAEGCFAESLAIHRRQFGDEHANTLLAILRMASLRVAQRRYAEAIELLVPIEEKVEPAFPGQTGALRHASLLGLLGKSRAGLAQAPADWSEAEANLLEAHDTFGAARGEKDKETLEWVQALADLYAAWDRAAPGEGHAERCAEWRQKLADGD